MKEVIWFALITIGIISLIVAGAYFVARAECNRVASDSNIKTSYRFIGGCYVEVNGRMIPKENWRGEYEQ